MKWNFFTINKSVDKGILKFTGTNQFVALIVAFRSYFVQYLLSGLNPGILTAVGWGNQFATLAESFLYTQFYTIASVRFSECFALRHPQNAFNYLYSVFNFLFLTGVVVFLMFFTCSESIITLINFKHTFAPNIFSVLSNSMVYLSLIPMINILSFLLVRILVSFQLLNKIFLIYTIIGQVVLLLLLWGGIYWFGYQGYIIGSAAGFLFNVCINLLLVKRNFSALNIGNFFKKMYQPLLFAAGIIIAGLILKNSIHEYQIKNPISVIITFTIIMALLYFKKIKNALLLLQKS